MDQSNHGLCRSQSRRMIPPGDLEVWLPACGFPLYEVSSLGRIRSAKHGKMLSFSIINGYYRVSLHIVGGGHKRYHRYVHVLVCEAFHGLRPNGYEVAHANGVRTDCHKDNLRWKTHVHNCQERDLHGTTAKGARNGNSKLTDAEVAAIRADTRRQVEIAAEFGISQGLVSQIKRQAIWR
jgi:hypothetical protein